ncbi:hypothetical protein BSL78_21562 [Apostichopus japonicus]|uniref:Uncharacterized protein n=1 Tax=Stichopus japonicus TaxID=307972 RepID=A0A2G8K0T2_STIJA|nr:hypothetical protein BSL78_21562 [Apostichopus japonicus]
MNCIRRALEQKKKLEAQKEAKRRSEVLEERRKRQQEATQRYQRLSRASPKKTPSRQDAVYSGPRLQEGVQMAKGYKFNGTSGKPSPAMEDVLRMVGHQENPLSSGYTQSPITSDNHSGSRSEQLSREVSSLDRNGNALNEALIKRITRNTMGIRHMQRLPTILQHHQWYNSSTILGISNRN